MRLTSWASIAVKLELAYITSRGAYVVYLFLYRQLSPAHNPTAAEACRHLQRPPALPCTAEITAMPPVSLILLCRPTGWLNTIAPYLLTPLYGVPSGAYRLHHVVMHHIEDNTAGWDLSATEAYQRDSLPAFIRYEACTCIPDQAWARELRGCSNLCMRRCKRLHGINVSIATNLLLLVPSLCLTLTYSQPHVCCVSCFHGPQVLASLHAARCV